KALPMFAAERAGLEALASTGAVRVPSPLAVGADEAHSWLILEWLDLVPRDAALDARLGEALAHLHRHTASRFGWEEDNFIGATPQPNRWNEDWLSFWREARLRFQLELLRRNGRGTAAFFARAERLLESMDAFFAGYRPAASLIHGDLWGGNAAAAGGTPVIFDPAVYYADREAELAMTELFGGFSRAFYDAYQATWPLDPGYATRKKLYQLYHLLNHANLFGGGYLAQAEVVIDRLLSEVGA
ncbi:MAG: fructosamine kinase family protein, partial [Zetaproteobacteria bacterium]